MLGKLDALAARIAAMDRSSLVEMLRALNCDFSIDFTDEYLNSISLERLQHIVLAVSLHESKPAQP